MTMAQFIGMSAISAWGRPRRRSVVNLALVLACLLLVWYAWRVVNARITTEAVLGWSSRIMTAVLVSATASWLLAAIRSLRPATAPATGASPSAGTSPGQGLTPEARGVAAAVLFEQGWKPRRLILGAGELVIGSAPGCSIRVDSPGVASRHCLLRAVPGEPLMVKDLGSRAGSRIGSRPLGPEWQPFRPGECLAIGEVRIEATR